ncbi:alpha/beta hydrolase [Streptomyces sp. NBC_01476]|uniref:alpha/beta fold hydrolase n=1 Tax=Streptomyces sp. NBC_01476 TaxID=2903881 RepID=UPI002E32417B|nr:alpha/beta hydrolase [Streptomyces sp. NBC_01476]
MNIRRSRILLAAGAASLALGLGVPALASATPSHTSAQPKPTIVLEHGAWSDGSSWSGVVKRLQAEGYPVMAPADPLRGVADDSAYLASVLAGVKGPVVLVGHSYGGTVITQAAAGNPNVKALVYVAAFAPDTGETVAALNAKNPGSHITQDALNPVPYTQSGGSGVDLYIKPADFADIFAGGLPSSTTAELAATQRPIDANALNEPVTAAAWKTIPSWYLVAENDHAISPATERFMARRAHAHTVEVRSPHAAQIAQPGAVASLIRQAARATG